MNVIQRSDLDTAIRAAADRAGIPREAAVEAMRPYSRVTIGGYGRAEAPCPAVALYRERHPRATHSDAMIVMGDDLRRFAFRFDDALLRAVRGEVQVIG